MSETQLPMTLTAAERRLITTLRDIPEGRVKVRVQQMLDDLMTFIKFPRCQWMQADGVPCGSVDRDCEQCEHLMAMMAQMSESMAEK